MAVFFNGTLYTSPVTVSQVDDSKMYARGLSVGNMLAILGTSEGGEPLTALRFGSPSEAKAVLRSGPLLDAINRAFSSSVQSPGPSTIIGVRVAPTTDAMKATDGTLCAQSTLTLKDGANNTGNNSILLTSTNYGLTENQIKVKVEAGSSVGLKLTTQFGTSQNYVDNLVRNCFSVKYADGATDTGTVTITNSTLTLTLNSVATVIDLAAYPTVQKLVDRLNSITSITAVVLNGNGDKPTLNGLDNVAAQDIKTAAYSVTATLQAAVEWFNSSGENYVNATRVSGATKPPAALDFTYMSGGNDGDTVPTPGAWQAAFNVLQNEDVQWVVPISSAAGVHAMTDSHVNTCSNILRKERRAICGMASGTTDAQAIAAAKLINSDRTSLTHLGVYDYDDTGALVLFQPYIAAAMISGAFSGLNPGTPMTNKSLRVRGLERKLLNPTNTDALINGGVLCLEETATGFKVVQSISTWLINTNYNRREVSVGVALDFIMRNVRNSVDNLRGFKGNPTNMALALEKAKTVLDELSKPEPIGPGVLVGDAENPPYKNLSVSLIGDQLALEFQASPVIPMNYITITCFAVPYSGSASLTPAQ